MQSNIFEKTPLSIARIIGIQVLYWTFFLFVIPQILVYFIIELKIIPTASLLLYVQWITYAISMVAAILLSFPLFKKESKLEIPKIVYTIIVCIVAMYCFNILFSLIMRMIDGPITSNNQQSLSTQVNYNIPMYLVMTVVFAPILEEIVFRGGIFRSLRFKCGFWIAAIISSFLFGFVHVFSSLQAGDFQDLIYLFLYGGLGMAFAYAYEYNKSIMACIIIHAIYNLIGMLPFLVG